MSAVEQEPQQTEYMPYSLRPMLPDDTKAVAEIEMEAFPTTWPPTPFRKELSNRLARYLVSYVPTEDADLPEAPESVVDISKPDSLLKRMLQGVWPRIGLGSRRVDYQDLRLDFIPGFVGMWFMADEAHITAIAVLETHQRRGIGELLLIGCIELAILRNADVVTLEVRVSNTLAQGLYKKYGFEIVGSRKKYYTDNKEDALIMTTGKIQEAEYQRELHKKIALHEVRWGFSERVLTTPTSGA
jgi:ribosomal-protein-alanine N-acetyltransferase